MTVTPAHLPHIPYRTSFLYLVRSISVLTFLEYEHHHVDAVVEGEDGSMVASHSDIIYK